MLRASTIEHNAPAVNVRARSAILILQLVMVSRLNAFVAGSVLLLLETIWLRNLLVFEICLLGSKGLTLCFILETYSINVQYGSVQHQIFTPQFEIQLRTATITLPQGQISSKQVQIEAEYSLYLLVLIMADKYVNLLSSERVDTVI